MRIGDIFSSKMETDRVRVSRVPLRSNRHTATAMYAMVDRYAEDLKGAAKLPLPVFFRHVANLPYKRDPRGREIIARPRIGLRMARARGIDCKKKSILSAAWLANNGIPYRFIGSSSQKLGFLAGLFQKPKIHHVFPQGYICLDDVCTWRNVDATYPEYKLFAPKPEVTRAVIFERP